MSAERPFFSDLEETPTLRALIEVLAPTAVRVLLPRGDDGTAQYSQALYEAGTRGAFETLVRSSACGRASVAPGARRQTRGLRDLASGRFAPFPAVSRCARCAAKARESRFWERSAPSHGDEAVAQGYA
jgi:hypothetical protein